jgi:hypothetical protein
MYRVIGIDSQEYGPVTAGQIREWIAAGRLNAQSKAAPEGTTEWKSLSEFPEFADAFRTRAYVPPGSGPNLNSAAEAKALESKILAAGYNIHAGACLSRAWEKLMADLWPMIGVTALIWVALTASHTVYVGILLTGPLLGGLYYYYLKKIRNQPAELSDAFAGFTLAFLQLLLASLVTGALTGIGLALCIVPGIYLFVAWFFALPLIIDKQLQFWDAMELSRKVVTAGWWNIAWLLLLCTLINIAGSLVCCVGIFFTLPLTGLATTYAYEEIFNARPAITA